MDFARVILGFVIGLFFSLQLVIFLEMETPSYYENKASEGKLFIECDSIEGNNYCKIIITE